IEIVQQTTPWQAVLAVRDACGGGASPPGIAARCVARDTLVVHQGEAVLDKLRGLFGGGDPAIKELLQTAEQIRAELKSKVLLFADQCVDDYIAFVKRWPPHLIEEHKQE